MNTKNAKDRVHDWIVRGTFDPEKGCRHGQDLIAAALGLSERTVGRCTRQLEAEGRLRIDRPRKRGACNTYYAATWTPTKRAEVLNRLREVRPAVLERRQVKCPPKRTAEPSRAHTPAEPPRRTPKALVAREAQKSADPAPLIDAGNIFGVRQLQRRWVRAANLLNPQRPRPKRERVCADACVADDFEQAGNLSICHISAVNAPNGSELSPNLENFDGPFDSVPSHVAPSLVSATLPLAAEIAAAAFGCASPSKRRVLGPEAISAPASDISPRIPGLLYG